MSELVPVFTSIGRIYELRLMLEFSGDTRYVVGPVQLLTDPHSNIMMSRTYCYVRYCNREDAETAIKQLNNYPSSYFCLHTQFCLCRLTGLTQISRATSRS